MFQTYGYGGTGGSSTSMAGGTGTDAVADPLALNQYNAGGGGGGGGYNGQGGGGGGAFQDSGGGGGQSWSEPNASNVAYGQASISANGQITVSWRHGSATLSLIPSVNPAKAAQPVTFTATVNPPAGDPAPTGTVSFSRTSLSTGAQSVLKTVALDGAGVASYTTSTLSAGANPDLRDLQRRQQLLPHQQPGAQ